MDWVIFNNRGSRISAFQDKDTASRALLELAEQTDRPLHLMGHNAEGRVVASYTVAEVAAALDQTREDHVSMWGRLPKSSASRMEIKTGGDRVSVWILRVPKLPDWRVEITGGDRHPTTV
jgi:hypothetical protein